MKNVFLSYHYDELNRKLARQVEELVESHGLRAVTGDVLGGAGLTDEVKRQIGEADAMIALLTRDQQLANGDWTTYEFCKSELQHARSLDGVADGGVPRTYPAIALVENGVPTAAAGLYQEREHIPLDFAAPLQAFLRLSRTIAKWKQRAGRSLKLQVMPNDVANEIWANQGGVQWDYRLSSGFEETEWRTAKPRREPGGLFVWVQVPDETMLIEVRVRGHAKSWQSDATPFHMPVTLAGQA